MSTIDATRPDSTLMVAAKHLLKRPALFIAANATVREAAQTMQSARVGSILIATDPPGIITDRDLRGRVLAAGIGSDTPVTAVMTRPLITLDSDRMACTALRLMLDENIHHLPLVEEGKVVGVISSSDLMLQQSTNPLYLRAAIDHLSDPPGTNYAGDIAASVEALYRAGLGAAEISQIVSGLNDALTKRLIALAEENLGPAPAPFAWLVFGSEGRLEQTLLTDQDNGLVYSETPEGEAYFSRLAERVVGDLIHVGFPRCVGGYMATRWRKPLTEWRELFSHWIHVPDPPALLDASIFFDFRQVAGALSLESLDEVLDGARTDKPFLAHLAHTAIMFSPPLGILGRVRTTRGKVDLKSGGISPIVGLARVSALAAGSRERSTLERLRVAGASGLLDRESARSLEDIFPFFLQLRLRRQLSARRENTPLDNQIDLADLSTLEQRHLREAFVLIKNIQRKITELWSLNRLG